MRDLLNAYVQMHTHAQSHTLKYYYVLDAGLDFVPA